MSHTISTEAVIPSIDSCMTQGYRESKLNAYCPRGTSFTTKRINSTPFIYFLQRLGQGTDRMALHSSTYTYLMYLMLVLVQTGLVYSLDSSVGYFFEDNVFEEKYVS